MESSKNLFQIRTPSVVYTAFECFQLDGAVGWKQQAQLCRKYNSLIHVMIVIICILYTVDAHLTKKWNNIFWTMREIHYKWYTCIRQSIFTFSFFNTINGFIFAQNCTCTCTCTWTVHINYMCIILLQALHDINYGCAHTCTCVNVPVQHTPLISECIFKIRP